jgi:hypothetical protein
MTLEEEDHCSDLWYPEVQHVLVAEGPTYSVGVGNAACIAIAVGDVKKTSHIPHPEPFATLE